MVLVLHLLLLFIYRKANAFTLQPLTLTSIVDRQVQYVCKKQQVNQSRECGRGKWGKETR